MTLESFKDATADKFLIQRASKSEMTIVFKDIDKVTMKDEIRGALEKQIDMFDFKGWRGTQISSAYQWNSWQLGE